MIKMKISKDLCTMGYGIYIYHEDEKGKITFSQPVQVVFDPEIKEGQVIQPTIKIDAKAFEFAIENDLPDITEKMIKQKDQDKNSHIKSLETIIHSFIGTPFAPMLQRKSE